MFPDVTYCVLLLLAFSTPGPRGTHDVCTVSLEKQLVSRLQCQRKKLEEYPGKEEMGDVKQMFSFHCLLQMQPSN